MFVAVIPGFPVKRVKINRSDVSTNMAINLFSVFDSWSPKTSYYFKTR
jgi:hypothetical protein